MGTRARVSILKRFEAGATAPANAATASLAAASKAVNFNWPTLGDVITAQQTQCATRERVVNDLKRLDDPALPQPMTPDPASILPIYEKP